MLSAQDGDLKSPLQLPVASKLAASRQAMSQNMQIAPKRGAIEFLQSGTVHYGLVVFDFAGRGADRHLAEPERFFPPLWVFFVPLDGLAQAVFKRRLSRPIQQSLGLLGAAGVIPPFVNAAMQELVDLGAIGNSLRILLE